MIRLGIIDLALKVGGTGETDDGLEFLGVSCGDRARCDVCRGFVGACLRTTIRLFLLPIHADWDLD